MNEVLTYVEIYFAVSGVLTLLFFCMCKVGARADKVSEELYNELRKETDNGA